MKLVTYFDEGPRIGILDGTKIWDLQRLYARYLFEAQRATNCRELAALTVPHDMALFIRLNDGRLDYMWEAHDYITSRAKQLGDVGDLARPHGLRRVVGQQPQALHGRRRRRIGGEGLYGDNWRGDDEAEEQSNQTAHFSSLRLVKTIPDFVGAKLLPGKRRKKGKPLRRRRLVALSCARTTPSGSCSPDRAAASLRS